MSARAVGRSRHTAASAELRSSPHVVCYWRGQELLLHQVATGKVASADPLAVRILHFFREWRPAAELLALWPEPRHAALRRALARLTAGAFLQTRGRRRDPADEALDEWAPWNPAAALFHFTARDVRWLRGRKLDDLEAARARAPGPSRPEPRTDRTRVVLPKQAARGEFAAVLLARRTWRGFGKKPLGLADLAQLLDLTWGVQLWRRGAGGESVAFKTSPSGGARHPIEAYVLARRVTGLRPGLYHYTADAKELELIRSGASGRQIEDYLGGQWYFRGAAAVVFMTAVVARELARYPHPRSYRTVLFEAGHLCQTFCLVATWLGLAPFCTAALADRRVERGLGVDGVGEVLLYAAGVGTRPADGRWVAWPKHAPGRPYLPPRSRPRRA